MTKEQEIKNLRDKAFGAISRYLKINNWELKDSPFDDSTMFYYIDPILGQAHRSDFAYLIQSERDINKYLKTLDKNNKNV